MTPLRQGLTQPPPNIAKLPRDERGYPVPYFVQWMDGDKPAPYGKGVPEFRIADRTKVVKCIMDGRCWVCGELIGRRGVFVVGPMCVINRNSAEPPSHYECAIWSLKSCPFLINPDMVRRENNLPDKTVDAPGIMVKRNPGVMAAYTSKTWVPYAKGDGVLINVGEPENVEWWTEGRRATKEEAQEALRGGYSLLERMCDTHEEESFLATQFHKALATT